MADLVITASQVKKGAGADVFNGISGASINAGQLCYLDAADNQLKLVDADVSAIVSTIKGVALCDAETDQPLQVQTLGTITIGAAASVSKGEIYVASGTAGGIAPEGDLAVSDFVSILGVGDASDGIVLSIFNSGVQL